MNTIRKIFVSLFLALAILLGMVVSPAFAWHGEVSVGTSCKADGNTRYSLSANAPSFPGAWVVYESGDPTSGTLEPGQTASGTVHLAWNTGETYGPLSWNATALNCTVEPTPTTEVTPPPPATPTDEPTTEPTTEPTPTQPVEQTPTSEPTEELPPPPTPTIPSLPTPEKTTEPTSTRISPRHEASLNYTCVVFSDGTEGVNFSWASDAGNMIDSVGLYIDGVKVSGWNFSLDYVQGKNAVVKLHSSDGLTFENNIQVAEDACGQRQEIVSFGILEATPLPPTGPTNQSTNPFLTGFGALLLGFSIVFPIYRLAMKRSKI